MTGYIFRKINVTLFQFSSWQTLSRSGPIRFSVHLLNLVTCIWYGSLHRTVKFDFSPPDGLVTMGDDMSSSHIITIANHDLTGEPFFVFS